MGWAEQEFETIDLGDERLKRRAVLLAERLGQKPGASIPGACESWAETAAAYRFLRNEQVGWDDVMSAHAQASRVRIREHAVVLCLQDSTELNYNAQAMRGLGPLSYEVVDDNYLGRSCCLTKECYRRVVVVVALFSMSRGRRLWACGRRARRWATQGVVHGRARCAEGASSICPQPGRARSARPPPCRVPMPMGFTARPAAWSIASAVRGSGPWLSPPAKP